MAQPSPTEISTIDIKNETVQLKKEGKYFVCNECEKKFSTKFSVKRHLSRSCKPTKKNHYSKCHLCDQFCESKQLLYNHFESVHGVLIVSEQKEFSSMEEFLVWKTSVEKDTVARYVNRIKKKLVDGSIKYSFICHRDGFFVSKSKQKRQLKKLGSNKINGHCPAAMYALVKPTGNISVTFAKTHVGHDLELGRIALSKEEKELISSKISQKIPLNEILNEVRDSSIDENVSRLHLLKKKDLHNIKSMYKLQDCKINEKEDYESVEAWVDHMKSSSNVVRFYKGQGESLPGYSYLNRNDFVLIFFNDAQVEILKQYCSDTVCVDRTHKQNPGDFELFTVIVLDNTKQGFPVAMMISSRSDTRVMMLYFDIIKSCLGHSLSPKTFMSDVAEQFYLAWSSVMPTENTQRLFCSWHVEKAWRENLKKIINPDKQDTIFKALKTIMKEPCKEQYKIMCKQCLSYLHENNDCKDFASFVEKAFFNSPSTWAQCQRIDAGVDANMCLESLHRTIKYIYSDGKAAKRQDRGVSAIMRYIRDKLHDRIATITKGKFTTKLSSIKERHRGMLKIKLGGRVLEDDSGWVVSASNSSKEFFITKNLDKTDCACDLRCSDCGDLCIHMFTCTCVDFLIKFNMCKHIHFVITTFNLSQFKDEEMLSPVHDYELDFEIPTEIVDETESNQELLEQKIKEFQQDFIDLTSQIQSFEQLDACIQLASPMKDIIKTEVTDNNLVITSTSNLPDYSTEPETENYYIILN